MTFVELQIKVIEVSGVPLAIKQISGWTEYKDRMLTENILAVDHLSMKPPSQPYPFCSMFIDYFMIQLLLKVVKLKLCLSYA